MNPIVLLFVQDAECRLEIDAVASELGAECVYVAFGDHLTDLVDRTKPFLLIIEFSNDVANWLQRHISEIKADHADFPVIGIVRDGDSEADYARLERVGCNRILTRKTFPKKAKALIEQYLR